MGKPGRRGSDPLRSLPDVLSEAVGRGFVAELPPTLTPHAQRLLASLGVPVRFVETASIPPALARAELSRGATIVDRLREALSDGRPHTARALHSKMPDVAYNGMQQVLGRLVRSGEIVRPARGVYRLAAH